MAQSRFGVVKFAIGCCPLRQIRQGAVCLSFHCTSIVAISNCAQACESEGTIGSYCEQPVSLQRNAEFRITRLSRASRLTALKSCLLLTAVNIITTTPTTPHTTSLSIAWNAAILSESHHSLPESIFAPVSFPPAGRRLRRRARHLPAVFIRRHERAARITTIVAIIGISSTGPTKWRTEGT